jgi:hypothetical protein
MVVVIISVAVIAGLFLLNWGIRRHGESPHLDPTWQPTDERFVDPSTGRHMRVYLDDGGGRHYVDERG